MSIRVCLFTDSTEPSGVGQHMLALAEQLLPRHSLALVCPSSPTGNRVLARAREMGIEALALAVRDRSAERRFARWLGEWESGVLHVHAGIGWEAHHGVYAGASAGVPVVRTEHLPYLLTEPDQQADYRAVVARADRIVCVAEASRDGYLAAGVPAAKLRVVRNGIRPEPVASDRGGLCRRLGLTTDAELVLTVARFTDQKGHAFLLDAAPAVLARMPRARFVWVGEGPLRGDLQERVRVLGLDERIIFAGRRSDVPELLAAADLLVLPSRFEGLPLVALEAMAAGLPVVGTRVCGTAEAVEDGVTGRLVEPGDPGALAAAILEALEDPTCARRWGEAGRERVRTEFSAERMARETAEIYREALELSSATKGEHDVALPRRRRGGARGGSFGASTGGAEPGRGGTSRVTR